MRTMLASYLERQFADRPDLLPNVVPKLPAGREAHAARQRRVGGRADSATTSPWSPRPIREITPTGIVTADGVEHEVDVIVYGTGFQASNFLTPMRVHGRGGIELHEQWNGDARAYLGITDPGLPELLLSLRTEHQHRDQRQHHLLLRVRRALHPRLPRAAARAVTTRRSRSARTCTTSSTSASTPRTALMAWGWSDVNSWYKNESGRVTQNWPFTLLEYWQRTLAPDPDDYIVTPQPSRSGVPNASSPIHPSRRRRGRRRRARWSRRADRDLVGEHLRVRLRLHPDGQHSSCSATSSPGSPKTARAVAIEAIFGCGECDLCLEGRYNLCATTGTTALGVMADGG